MGSRVESYHEESQPGHFGHQHHGVAGDHVLHGADHPTPAEDAEPDQHRGQRRRDPLSTPHM
jgi:hypothetical protein